MCVCFNVCFEHKACNDLIVCDFVDMFVSILATSRGSKPRATIYFKNHIKLEVLNFVIKTTQKRTYNNVRKNDF